MVQTHPLAGQASAPAEVTPAVWAIDGAASTGLAPNMGGCFSHPIYVWIYVYMYIIYIYNHTYTYTYIYIYIYICTYIYDMYYVYMNNCVWDGMGRWDVMGCGIECHFCVCWSYKPALPPGRHSGLDGFRGPNGFHHFAVAMEIGLRHAPAANDRLLLLMPNQEAGGTSKTRKWSFKMV